ncbi:MAG: SCP2 sterol-binding domain-containing protein [Legionellaceae bacterium]|nr:SCP2 sterol-binding domain-containing protein [Legionellaceae bacterium]
MSIPSFIHNLINTLLQEYVDWEASPIWPRLLAEQKTLLIEIQPFGAQVFVQFLPRGAVLVEKTSADTRIECDWPALLRLATLAQHGHMPSSVKITGDLEFAQQLQQCLNGVIIDWETPLTQITGNFMAVPLLYFLNQSKAFAQRLLDTVQYALSTYLQDELRQTPCREEVEDFYQDLYHTTLDVDRAAARLPLKI